MLFENAAVPAKNVVNFFTFSIITTIQLAEPAARSNYTEKLMDNMLII